MRAIYSQCDNSYKSLDKFAIGRLIGRCFNSLSSTDEMQSAAGLVMPCYSQNINFITYEVFSSRVQSFFLYRDCNDKSGP
jgi:hypothetical protein